MSKEETAATPTWRELAVARSLDPARARAEGRVQRYLDAAFELLDNDTGGDFTVQEVVERSGQSLRGFYQYFAGKHELLLAVFEESIRTTAEHLREVVDQDGNPLDRVRRFVVEYYAMCRPATKGRAPKKRLPRAMAEFAQQLLTSHPQEASRAFGPLVSLFEELLLDADSVGMLRTDLPLRRIAGIVLEATMFNAFAVTISGPSSRSDTDDAELLWDLLFSGIGARVAE